MRGYAIGDVIQLGLTFSEAVTVTGIPQITLDVGGASRTAPYSAGSGSTVLTFTYTVAAGDEDTDGLAVVANSLSLNGGAIRAGITDAALGHAGLQATDHRVDGIAPTVTVGGETRVYVPPDRQFNVVFYFSEPVFGLTDSDITVTNGAAHDVRAPRPYGSATWSRYTRWDAVVEPASEGPVTVTLRAGAATDAYGNGSSAPGNALSVIAASPVTVAVTRITSGFAEGGTAEFTVTRSRDNGAIPVSLSLDQTGDMLSGTVEVYPAPADPNAPATPREVTFTQTPFTLNVTFAAGETSKRIAVPTEDDRWVEEDGTITLSVPSNTTQYKYIPAHADSATSEVRDNEVAPIVNAYWIPPVQPYTATQLETEREGGRLSIAYLRNADNGPLAVSLHVTDSAGLLELESPQSSGYEVENDGTLRLDFDEGSRYETISISIRDDDTVGAGGSVTIAVLADDDGQYMAGANRGSITVPIADDDSPLTVTLDAPAAVVEGEQVLYTLTRVWEVSGRLDELTVNLQLEQTGDYVIWPQGIAPDGNGLVNIPVTFADRALTATLALDTEDDEVSRANGSLSAELAASSDNSYTVGAGSSQTTVLRDNDLPTVSVIPVSSTITEGASARYRITRQGNTAEAISVGLYVTGLPKIMTVATEAIVLTSESEDPSVQLALYGTRVDYIMEFAAGETQKELSLTTEADSRNEGDGWLAVSILEADRAPYAVGVDRAQIHVVDDDLPTVSLNQPVGPTELTLSADGTTWEGEIGEATSFSYSVSCSGVDQFPEESGTFLAPLTTRVFHSNHPAFYGEEAQSILGYNVSSIRPVGFNCSDTAITQSTYRFYVGPENGVLEIELILPSDLIPLPGRRNQFQTELFAEHRRQYAEAAMEAESAGTLITRENVFAPGSTARLTPRFWCNESSVEYCPRYAVGTVKKIRLTVINRDPTILIRAETAAVTEGQQARFILERQWAQDLLEDAAPYSETEVYLRVSQEGRYITDALPTTITFGQNEVRKVIALQTVDDDAFGGGGSATIELLPDTSTGSVNQQGKYSTWQTWRGHTPAGGRSDRATITIADNDEKPGISIASSMATEGDAGQASMDFTVTLDSALSEAVTVDYVTSDGTASAGSDYTAVTAGTVTIPAGDTQATFSVAVLGDTTNEADETFIVTISLPVTISLTDAPPGGGHLAAITGGPTASAVGAILDDDPAVVTVVAKQESVVEGNAAIFTLTRAGFAGQELPLQVLLRAPGRVEMQSALFAAGESSIELSVPTTDNDLVDHPSTREYSVQVLGDGAGPDGSDMSYTPGDPEMATVEVTDNDSLQVVTIEPIMSFVPEGGNPGFIFRRTGADMDISEALPITLYRQSGSPQGDPGSTSFVRFYGAALTFAAGESELTYNNFHVCTPDVNELFCDNDMVDSYLPYIITAQIFGDGGPFGLNRVWRAGDPDTATVVFYDNDGTKSIELVAQYPNSVEVGQTVRVDFTVRNTGSAATGDTITISSVRRSPGDSDKVKPDEPRVSCAISGSLQPNAQGTCRARFVVTQDDREMSPLSLDSTATDGEGASASQRLFIRIFDGVAVGFTEATRLSVTEPTYGEDPAKAVLEVTRIGESDQELQVAYTVEPIHTQNRPYPAEEGLDYVDNSTTPGILTFADGDATKDIIIDIPGDQIQEQREQFRVTLHPPDGVRTSTKHRVVAIVDGSPPEGVSYRPTAKLVRRSPERTPESAGKLDFTVSLDREWGEEARFEVRLDTERDLTATPAIPRLGQAGDFEAPDGAIQVTIPAGELRFRFSLDLYDDDVREEDETFRLVLGSTNNRHRNLIGSQNTVLVTIEDDDVVEPEMIELALIHADMPFESLSEAADRHVIKVTASFSDIRWPTDAADAPLRSPDPRTVDTEVRVQIDAVNSTADPNDLQQFNVADSDGDFRRVEFFDIVIPAGETSGTTRLRLKPRDDDVDEDDETVILLGTEIVGTDSDGQLTVTPTLITIEDDDTRGITRTPWEVNLLPQVSIDENSTYTYTMVLDSAPTGPVTIAIAPINEDDPVSIDPATLTFTASNWGTPQAIEVTALEDGSKAAPTVHVGITHEVSGGDYEDITVGNINFNISDTTQAYVFLDDAEAMESDGYIEFIVNVRPSSYRSSVSVRYTTVDGTAVAGTDYTREVDAGESYKVVTIPGIQGSATIRIPIADDQVYEPSDKTFSLQLRFHAGRALLDGNVSVLNATGTIRDDDPQPVVDVEGPAGGVSYIPENVKSPVTFSVTLTGRSAEDVTVSYSTGMPELARLRARTDSNQLLAEATAGMDYATTSGSVVFSPGETTKQVTVEVIDDDVSEDTEFFGLRIGNAQNARLRNGGTEATADVGLLDDDPRGVVIDPISINLQEPASGQAAQSSTYTVKLTSTPTDSVTVAVGGADSAIALSGDTLSSTNTLTFTTSNWDTAQTVTVTPVKDANGTSETVTLTHMLAGGDYTGIAADSVTVNVTDSDVRDIVLSPASLTVTEGQEAGVSYTVKLATQPSDSVRVTVSGHVGTDLTISGSTLTGTQLTFTTSNWDTAQTVVVKAGDDPNNVNEEETLTHTASGADYENLTKDLSVTVDDDAPETVEVSFGAAEYPVNEGDPVTVTVSLSADPERDVTIPIRATNAGGASASDYSGVPASVSFSAGVTERTFSVLAEQDTLDDDGESVTLSFGTLPAGVTLGTPGTTSVTINDDDVTSVEASETVSNVLTVEFVSEHHSIPEGSTKEIAIRLSGATDQRLVIPLTYERLGQTTDSDFSGPPPWVKFQPGETSKSFSLHVTHDLTYEMEHGVRIAFGDLPAGVAAGSKSLTTALFVDDDKGDSTLKVGRPGLYWYDDYSHVNTLDECSGHVRFKVIWTNPAGKESADEWKAYIRSYGEMRVLSYEFKDTPIGPEMVGTIDTTGGGSISVSIRGRWGETWGTWSDISALWCRP